MYSPDRSYNSYSDPYTQLVAAQIDVMIELLGDSQARVSLGTQLSRVQIGEHHQTVTIDDAEYRIPDNVELNGLSPARPVGLAGVAVAKAKWIPRLATGDKLDYVISTKAFHEEDDRLVRGPRPGNKQTLLAKTNYTRDALFDGSIDDPDSTAIIMPKFGLAGAIAIHHTVGITHADQWHTATSVPHPQQVLATVTAMIDNVVENGIRQT